MWVDQTHGAQQYTATGHTLTSSCTELCGYLQFGYAPLIVAVLATSDVIEVALPTLVQYMNEQSQSTGFVMQFKVVPDAFSSRAVEVIFQ